MIINDVDTGISWQYKKTDPKKYSELAICFKRERLTYRLIIKEKTYQDSWSKDKIDYVYEINYYQF